jgi:hypothetical protein
VTFSFDFSNFQDIVPDLGISVVASRSYSDFSDPSTYQYKATYNLKSVNSKKFLGSLTCKKIQENVSVRSVGKTVTILGASGNGTRKAVLSTLGKEAKMTSKLWNRILPDLVGLRVNES